MHKQPMVGQYKFRWAAVLIGVIIAVAAAVSSMLLFVPASADENTNEAVGAHNVLLDEKASLSAGEPVEYSMASSWTYGEQPQVAMPRLKYEQSMLDDGLGQSKPEKVQFSMALYKGNVEIFTDLSQDPDSITNVLTFYINQFMPAGDYTLSIAVPEVRFESAMEYEQWWAPIEDEEGGDTVKYATETIPQGTVYESYTYTFEFTVHKAEIPEAYKADIESKLVEKSYQYIYDGEPHFYTLEEELDILTAGVSIYDRGEEYEGVYWKDKKADGFFGGMSITYNLYRMQNNHYHTIDYLTGNADEVDCAAFVPRDPGVYTVYFQISGDNYKDLVDITDDSVRRVWEFHVTVYGIVDIPEMPDVIYNGTVQKGYISENQYYTVRAYEGWEDVGTHYVTLELRNPECYMWKGQSLDNNDRPPTCRISFDIVKASNQWVRVPDVVRWVEGSYDPKENVIVGEAVYGDVVFTITDEDGNVVYSNEGEGVNLLAKLKAGTYLFTAYVEGTDNYSELTYPIFMRVLKKQGLPWWGTLSITVGALLLAALIILILYKKGVFRLLTDKIVLSIRTKATVDATIAAVRASKVAEASHLSVEQAVAKERAEELAESRKKAAEAERNKTDEEKMAALEAKAQVAAERAERMRAKAEAMQARVDKLKSRVGTDNSQK